MNHSLLSADRNTHIKIVSVALVGAILIVAGAIGARLTNAAPERLVSGPVVKAGVPAAFTRNDVLPDIR
jgi:VIT1/CCC1 family predicted Fe2+/Mn2+ transporter